MIRVGIIGIEGRIGRHLVEQILADDELVLSAAITQDDSTNIGVDAGVLIGVDPIGVVISTDLGAVLSQVDVLIDFTIASAVVKNLEVLQRSETPLVIGTTGFSEDDLIKIRTAAHLMPILLSPNMSLGINLVYSFLAQATKALGAKTDIEIIEMHHRFKKDAPSGTALQMGQVIADAMGKPLDECAVYSRNEIEGARIEGQIGFSSLRGGSVVGDHTVIFADLGERIEITHKAQDRSIFAKGALFAAKRLYAKHPGLYSMDDLFKK